MIYRRGAKTRLMLVSALFCVRLSSRRSLALNVIKLGGAVLVLIFNLVRRLWNQVASSEVHINSIFGVDGSVSQANLCPAFAVRRKWR